MRLLHRLPGLLVLFALSATVAICVDPSYAQTPGSATDTGLQILQGLSPEQRDAISQQFGGLGAGAGGANGAQGAIARPTPLNEAQQNLMLQQQRDMLLEAQRQRGEQQRLSPFLQGEDWVVITVDSNPLPAGNQPPPTTPQAGALGALGGVTPSQQQNLLGNLAPSLAANQSALAQAAGAGTAGAANNPANGVAAATAAAMSPSAAQGVTAGGYALLPPNCAGQSELRYLAAYPPGADR